MLQSQVFVLRSFSMNETDSIVIMANCLSGVPPGSGVSATELDVFRIYVAPSQICSCGS